MGGVDACSMSAQMPPRPLATVASRRALNAAVLAVAHSRSGDKALVSPLQRILLAMAY